MLDTRRIDRRTFVADLGKGAFALAVISLAACSPAAIASARPSASSGGGGSSPTPGTSPGASPSASAAGSSAPPSDAAGGAPRWSRVNLGFVSAYILARGGEAAIVDTGVAGSEDEIEAALGSIGLDWASVAHVVLTHRHADHAGSAAAVLERATGATGYTGAEDIAGITVPRALTAVADGDRVFDLRIVTTPGHTAGSVCVLDETAGVLVAGDALRTEGGKPTPPGAQFTEDMDAASASIAKLGALTFETLLVGHGDPIEAGASAAVAALAGG